MVNKCFLVGRLGADPEVRYTPAGSMVMNFNMATDESYRNNSGEKVEKTEWHRVVVWGKQAEFCANYLKKGKLVFVEGKLQTQTWDDKDGGGKRSRTEIVALNIRVLEKKEAAESEEGRDQAPDDPPF